LVATLHGALTLAQVDANPVLVAEHLHLDVPRPLDVLLAVDLRRAEGRPRLRLAGVEGLGDVLAPPHDAHATPAPAGRGLENDRVADPVRDIDRLRGVLQRQLAAGDHGDARLRRQLARLRPGAHEPA